MNSQSLVDLAPWARLLSGATFLTAILLFIWYLRSGTQAGRAGAVQRRRLLLLMTLFLSFDLVLVGSFTRLTDSGLGCPDWPGCYGSASPLGAKQHIESAQAAMPTGPVTHSKAWIEMLHRYLAMAVGGLIAVQAAWAWLDRWRGGGTGSNSSNSISGSAVGEIVNPSLPTLTLLWVCLQGLFGALTVTLKLLPAIVSLHLLGAYILLMLLVLQLARFPASQSTTQMAQASDCQQSIRHMTSLRRWLWLALFVVTWQSLLGAWVSTNYAVLACNEFPRCQGEWWPLMNFTEGFELWRPLGMTANGEILSFQALTAIHFTHRLFAGLAFLVLLALLWRLRQVASLQRATAWLAALIALQLLTGLSNVVLDWPLVAAVLHTGGAGALIALVTWLICQSSYRQFHRSKPQGNQ